MSQNPSERIFFIGLSGPSSAGKTTLAHLLSHIFPNVVSILHSDDFCKGFDDIPTVNGYLDADGPDGVDFQRLAHVLDYVKAHDGTTPPDFKSWQQEVFPGQDAAALKLVPLALLQEMQAQAEKSLGTILHAKIVIVEGFMLYNIESIRSRLDARLFVRLRHRTAKRRRMTRPFYGKEAKPEEFWKTEDYFETMVWRNYVEQHAGFFENGDVEGQPLRKICVEKGMEVQDELDVNVVSTLRWATEVVVKALTASNR